METCGLRKNFLSPMDLPSVIMGIEGWLDTILFDPKNTRLMLDKTVKHFIDWANTLLDDGADLLVMPSMFTSPHILTRKIVQESVIPVLAEVFQEIHRKGIQIMSDLKTRGKVVCFAPVHIPAILSSGPERMASS